MDTLMLGVGLAWMEKNGHSLSTRALLLAFAAVSGCVAVLAWRWPDRGMIVMSTIGYSIVALFYVLILSIALRCHIRFLKWRPLTSIGVRAYALYLFHLPVLGLVRGSESSSVSDGPASLVALLILAAVVALSWRYLEKPLIERSHRWRYEGSRNALYSMAVQASNRTV
jgi:peptidoglycan/LPS O-acetylase OafA/YrhL